MPDLKRIVDCFTRARYAAWAGDLKHCRRLLDLVENYSKAARSQDHRWDSLGLILHSADQLRERLDAQTSFPSEDVKRSKKKSVADKTLLISTQHLRGVVHRTGDFDFELRAYLNDLNWESDLYRRASSVAREYSRTVPSLQQEEEEGKTIKSRRSRR